MERPLARGFPEPLARRAATAQVICRPPMATSEEKLLPQVRRRLFLSDVAETSPTPSIGLSPPPDDLTIVWEAKLIEGLAHAAPGARPCHDVTQLEEEVENRGALADRGVDDGQAYANLLNDHRRLLKTAAEQAEENMDLKQRLGEMREARDSLARRLQRLEETLADVRRVLDGVDDECAVISSVSD